MKKKLTTAIVLLLVVFTIVSNFEVYAKNTSKDSGDVLTNSNIEIANGVTSKNYLNFGENLPYNKTESYCIYHYLNFRFERFNSFISVSQNGYSGDFFIPGTDFVLTDKALWFIDDSRNISKFDYLAASYKKSNQSLGYKKYTKTYKKADTQKKFDSEYDEYDEVVKIDDKSVGFFIPGQTVFFQDNIVGIYYKGRLIDKKVFPFSFKEAGVLHINSDVESTFQFVLENNTVGQIDLSSKEGITDYRIIVEDSVSSTTTHKRTLFNSLFKNIDQINLSNGYMLYYEDSKLIGSDGKIHFKMDDLPWKAEWSGDFYGPYKGIPDCSIMANYKDTTEDNIDKMLKETGITY